MAQASSSQERSVGKQEKKEEKTLSEQDLFVSKEADLPKEYHGQITDITFDPKHGEYKQPTIIIEVKPEEYKNNQFMFLRVDSKEQNFDAHSANPVNIRTYTGVFFRELIKTGFPIKKGETVIDVSTRLKGMYVHARRASQNDIKAMGADKVKGDKWLIVAVSASKPGTV